MALPASSISTIIVVKSSVPPSAIASRAFTARFHYDLMDLGRDLLEPLDESEESNGELAEAEAEYLEINVEEDVEP